VTKTLPLPEAANEKGDKKENAEIRDRSEPMLLGEHSVH
jgi:hypothetical protein